MKRITSLLLALIMLLSCAFSTSISGYAAKTYATTKLEEIQKISGFVPGKTSIVTGNCYAFVSAVCEKLFGYSYQEQLYNGYQCKHKTGKFYEVSLLKTSTDTSTESINKIINFFIQNGMPGDIVHYGSLSNSSSTHTFMIQSIDNEKMRIFHSNYSTKEYSSSTCHIDTIYWDSFRKSPTQSVYTSDGKLYSHNTLFYNKMRYSGMGVTINRSTNYNSLYYAVGAESTVPPVLKASRTTPTSIKLSWNNVTGAEKYYVVYKEKSESSYHVLASGWKTTSMDVKYLKVGTKYCFKVRAYAAGKWMDYSDVLTVKAMPPKVSSATIKPADKGMSISWAKKDGLTGVKIYKSTTGKDDSFTLLKTLSGTASTYLDTAVKYGGTYYYKIERYVTVSGTTYKTNSNVFSKKYELKTPTMICDRLSTSSVKITITGDGCQSEFVYYLQSGGKTVQAQKSSKASVLTLTSLELGREYTIFCAEKTSLGQGSYGNITFTVLPKEVTNIVAAMDKEGIKVTFDSQSDVDGYRILRSINENSGYAEIAEISNASASYIDKSVKLKTTYYYMVKSFKNVSERRYVGECFDASNAVKYVLPATAKLKASRVSPNSIKLSWKSVKFAKTYTLQYKEKGGKWTTINDIKERYYTLKKLNVGSVYYFRVRAVNSVGNGDYSSKVKLKALPPTPEKPTAAIKSKKIKVSYKPANYANGYMLYRSNKKNGKYTLIATINGNKTKSYTDKKVLKGKTYYYKLVCFKNKNGTTYKSARSKPVKIKMN